MDRHKISYLLVLYGFDQKNMRSINFFPASYNIIDFIVISWWKYCTMLYIMMIPKWIYAQVKIFNLHYICVI